MDQQWYPSAHAMFNGEQGTTININGGNFTQNNHQRIEHKCCDADDGFKHLQAHVVTSAFDSAEEIYAPKCHPNTRQAVQEDIMDWIQPIVMRIKRMLWLNGSEGTGKTAIVRSIVDLCLAQNIPVAKFFFSGTDPARNTIKPVAATLVYQLIQQIPDLLGIIISKIESNPLIFNQSPATQFKYLIFDPLRQLHNKCQLGTAMILFDGVDQCINDEKQTNFVRLIANFLSSHDLPVIALFSSRGENQLQQVFRSPDISQNSLQLLLDTQYFPDNDIRCFLNDNFEQIKKSHPLNNGLEEDWPSPACIEEIVKDSSGKFLYTSTVINFISSPHHNPTEQLESVRRMRPAQELTPFAQLDALYRHIFSQTPDIERTSLILAWCLFSSEENFRCINTVHGFDSNNISLILADLSSVITYKNDEVHFHHSSLPDFLLDPNRSQRYCLDKELWCTRLAIHCFCRLSAGMDHGFLPLVRDFLPRANGTAELREQVLSLDFDQVYIIDYKMVIEYLTVIHNLDFKDHGELYQTQLNNFTRCVLKHSGEDTHIIITQLQQDHDISAILAETESENPCVSCNNVEHGPTASPVVNASTLNQHVKAKGTEHSSSRNTEVKVALPQSSSTGHRKNTTIFSRQSPAKVERTIAKKTPRPRWRL